jgi:hypothetical protein
MIAAVRPHLDGAASSNINVIEATPRYHTVLSPVSEIAPPPALGWI